MLTATSLAQRLAEWAIKTKETIHRPGEGISPIALYQAAFGLYHELKSSTSLSTEPAVLQLTPLIERVDVQLRALALDELALASADDGPFYDLLTNLEDVSTCEVFLEKAFARAATHPRRDLASALPGYAWDSLAKARAESSSRHRYSFFEHRFHVELNQLPACDAVLQQQWHALQALPIARSMEPRTTGTRLELSIRQLLALPHNTPAPSPDWRVVRAT